MYKLVRSFFFLLNPETAHNLVFNLIKLSFKLPLVSWLFKKTFVVEDQQLERKLWGITFKNPVGLAAGLDKDAELVNELGHIGFGFVEIGTVTPKPQPGNPKPRLFRLKRDKALINRMGFNNKGVDHAIRKLKKNRKKIIVGGNIGKNKITPNDQAVDDYLYCYDKLYPYVDYFVINVSSPNTPGLRELQEKEPLKKLLQAVSKKNNQQKYPKPLLLKIAPDLSNQQLDDIIEIVKELYLDGVIATNTTIKRNGLSLSKEELEKLANGGLSGQPLLSRSNEVIRYLHSKMPEVPIIGVGGITKPEDAIEKLKEGASLVQIYTGFVYEGPPLIKRINKLILHNNF